MEPLLSVIVPARNEEALVGATIERILAAVSELGATRVGALHLATTPAEVLVVDDASGDRTATVVARYVERHGVRLIRTRRRGAASARNAGAASARGRIFCFVDADTQIPRDTLTRIRAHCDRAGFEGGFTALAPLTSIRQSRSPGPASLGPPGSSFLARAGVRVTSDFGASTPHGCHYSPRPRPRSASRGAAAVRGGRGDDEAVEWPRLTGTRPGYEPLLGVRGDEYLTPEPPVR